MILTGRVTSEKGDILRGTREKGDSHSSHSRTITCGTERNLTLLLHQCEFLAGAEALGILITSDLKKRRELGHLMHRLCLTWKGGDTKMSLLRQKNGQGAYAVQHFRSHVIIIWTQSGWETQCKLPGIGCVPFPNPHYLISWRLDVYSAFGQSRLHSDEKGPFKSVVSGQQTGAGCLHWGREKHMCDFNLSTVPQSCCSGATLEFTKNKWLMGAESVVIILPHWENVYFAGKEKKKKQEKLRHLKKPLSSF